MSGPARRVFRVWAPRSAAGVELVLRGERRAMEAAPDGWWEVSAEAAPGDEYAFLVDGEGPYPDPRSPYQPEGVHGPSRLVDHESLPGAAGERDPGLDRGPESRVGGDELQWNPPPLASGVVYELHVGTFTPDGTFDAAIGRLDHLVDLGVTHVELMPVATFPGSRGWGYDGVDLFAPHPAYGGPEGLARLVDACHRRGLAVLLDVVYNHLGPDGNYLGVFGPYFTGRYRTPWGEAVNLDGAGSDEVRRFFVDNACHWLGRYGIDGLRLDAVHAFHDRSALPFLEELALEVEALAARLGRHLVLVAESDLNDPRLVRAREAGGFGLDASWSDDFHHALHALLTGERQGYYADFGRLEQVAKALTEAYVYTGERSGFRGRRHGRSPGGLPGHRFLGYLQNHDQVGNRARGDRITHLVSPERARVGAALVLTSPFVPLVFQGEEWGASTPFQYFTDHQDPELAEAVRQGRRREFAAFGWDPEAVPDPQSEVTFRRSALDWDERHREPHSATLAWYRDLVRLRRRRPELTDGRLDRVAVDWDEEAGWISVRRGALTVLANLSSGAGRGLRRVPLGGRPVDLLLASDSRVRPEGAEAVLPPDSAAIFEVV
ncbi:MAG: malto-oligosyltrehalose trehalohydrolase [Thermoanaerobaculia bacterium]